MTNNPMLKIRLDLLFKQNKSIYYINSLRNLYLITHISSFVTYFISALILTTAGPFGFYVIIPLVVMSVVVWWLRIIPLIKLSRYNYLWVVVLELFFASVLILLGVLLGQFLLSFFL